MIQGTVFAFLRGMSSYKTIESERGLPIKAWIDGVPAEPEAIRQLQNIARLPCVHHHVAAMPDVHFGIGATVGSVIATKKAIIPAAVGVDIGCGMAAVRTSLVASDLPENLKALRSSIERAVPHGRTSGRRNDKGSWSAPPNRVLEAWGSLADRFKVICDKHRQIEKTNNLRHLGTLGTGNHFIELCLDEDEQVWVMLHSGSRGVGNRIGTHFIALAKKDAQRFDAKLPDINLAYFREGAEHFEDYVQAVEWAQDFARINREIMMDRVLDAMKRDPSLPPFKARLEAVNCHHNYVQREQHFGEEVFVTRKGAVRAGQGEMGIIPGSMGARSFIVRGKGNPESFSSCSHGAGRKMSRTAAKKRYSVDDHARATAHVECRKDEGVIDETPMAYKDIDAVMKAQSDLVDVAHTLRQVICVKG
jgi:tRNA-splicing ligase RtcB